MLSVLGLVCNTSVPSTPQPLVSIHHTQPQLLGSGSTAQPHSVYRQASLSLELWGNVFFTSLDSFLLYCAYLYITAALSDPNSDFCLLHSAELYDLFGLHFITLWSEICPQEEVSIDRGTALGQVHFVKNNVLILVFV